VSGAHALTPTLSQGEREYFASLGCCPKRGLLHQVQDNTVLPPLPLGEGWGEGDGLPKKEASQ